MIQITEIMKNLDPDQVMAFLILMAICAILREVRRVLIARYLKEEKRSVILEDGCVKEITVYSAEDIVKILNCSTSDQLPETSFQNSRQNKLINPGKLRGSKTLR